MSLPPKKVAIVQSNYIPWKGYFDLMRASDAFILYDQAQYTERDWRNRNKIKTSRGAAWISIPVQTKGKRLQAIKDVKISDGHWAKRHWDSIQRAYARATHFKSHKAIFEPLYRDNPEKYLSRINRVLIEAIRQTLGITTPVFSSSDFQIDAKADKSEKLLQMCLKAQASVYLSGPAAKDYLKTELFKARGVEVRFVDYSGYPTYTQLFPPFVHELSVLDLIFNEGPNALNYMKVL